MKETKERGITLIALIITIVVMIIIIAVVVSISLGENGIVFKAKGASTGYLETEGLENGALTGSEVEGQIDSLVAGGSTTITTKSGTGGGEEIQDQLSKTTSYVGCFAEIDGNTTNGPEGIIYVDLMDTEEKTITGTWNNAELGNYSYTTITESKPYSISDTDYTGSSFEAKPIITAIGDGVSRFYVMALSDIDNKTYRWHIRNCDIEVDVSTALGTGKTNTATAMQYTELTENSKTFWSKIGTQVARGWYVPSRAEWSAFGDAVYTKIKNSNGVYCTTSNYGNFGLSNFIWSSSKSESDPMAYDIAFANGCIYTSSMNLDDNVRLGTNF